MYIFDKIHIDYLVNKTYNKFNIKQFALKLFNTKR